MKEIYISAEMEIFMFEQKQVIVASGVIDTTQADHDNSLYSYDDLL